MFNEHKLKLVEEVVGLSLDNSQKRFFETCVEEAKRNLTSKGEWRFKVSDLAIGLHNEIFGDGTRWNVNEARVLRSMFAREIGQSLRTVEIWMEVKAYVVDELPATKTEHVTFVELVDVLYLIKNKKLTAHQALEKLRNKRKDPNQHRMDLILRYSSNLLASVRKFDMKNSDRNEINLAVERLEECIQRLSNFKEKK
jgi:hypothetical protein